MAAPPLLFKVCSHIATHWAAIRFADTFLEHNHLLNIVLMSRRCLSAAPGSATLHHLGAAAARFFTPSPVASAAAAAAAAARGLEPCAIAVAA